MSDSRQAFSVRRLAAQPAAGILATATITAVCYPLRLEFPVAGCLYLLVVVVQSAFSSFAASAIVSVVAIASLDYFFVPPLFTFRIDRPLDALALLTFLVTALVITRLASRARQEARNAEGRRKDLARLYELASRLVSVGPDVAVKRGYLGIFREIFRLRAVCLFDREAAEGASDGLSQADLSALTKGSFLSGADYDSEHGQIAVRALRAGSAVIGAVGFEGLEDADTLAGPLSMLAVAMMQRARSFEHASEAAAATQIEVLRSAILDAFAHQFKTPLAAILTAAGTLREVGPLSAAQEEMAETIETQASGLGQLTTRLLRMARLDRDEINPRLQPTELDGLIRRIVNQHRFQVNGHDLVVQVEDHDVEVLCDPDMLALSFVQLLDNAFRYSPPGTRITVTVGLAGESALIRVSNQGPPILEEEQNRIFDRFYRGSAGLQTSGTGLGLYVARKIVLAHGGSLDLDTEHRHGAGTTFCLRLPLARKETGYEIKASESVGSR